MDQPHHELPTLRRVSTPLLLMEVYHLQKRHPDAREFRIWFCRKFHLGRLWGMISR